MHLDLELIISQIFAFILTLLILKRFAWKPFLGLLEERRQKIQLEFDTIAEQKKATQDMIEDYQSRLHALEEQAGAKIEAAAEEGRKIAHQIQHEAHKHAKAMIEKASDDISHEIAQARQELKKDIVKIVVAVTQKVTAGQLSPEGQEKLIADFVDQAGFQ